MKARNREINIFSLSLMDVISGAMGAFLIVVVILARYRAIDQENDPEKLRPRLNAAMQALANASVGTEKIFRDLIDRRETPNTRGLSRGETVPEITALGGALRHDIDKIRNHFGETLLARTAAVDALAHARDGTERIFKDRIGVKPKTLGIKKSDSAPEIKTLDQALRQDIDTIHKELRKGKKSVPDTSFVVTSTYVCVDDDKRIAKLDIVSDGVDPSTGPCTSIRRTTLTKINPIADSKS